VTSEPGKAEMPSTEGNIVGNHYDKYGTKNPIARWLMEGFLRAVTDLYRGVAPRSVLEVGCGEGKLADRLLKSGPRPERFEACDLEIERLATGLDPAIRFRAASIYELPFEAEAFDLVVCCEVLEHLTEPRRGLAELRRVARRAVLVSTPREPIWRAMNLARGKYVTDLGNTPGHIQHWGRRQLVAMVSELFEVTEQRTPIPWTVLLGRPKKP
jgi:ubiquinone/menaquinone biosynthesis C-methylase UbiE